MLDTCMWLFQDTGTNEIYTYRHTLSPHDARPIYGYVQYVRGVPISEAYDKDERNNLALFIGEPRHRARHIGQFHRRFDPPIAGIRCILPFLLRRKGFRSSLSGSCLIDPDITHDPIHPADRKSNV